MKIRKRYDFSAETQSIVLHHMVWAYDLVCYLVGMGARFRRKTIRTFFILPLFLLSAIVSAEDGSRWFPTEHLYPTYLADPYELGFHMQLRSYDKLSIPDTSSSRWDLLASVPMLLYEKKNTDSLRYGWQLLFLGGLRGQFDLGNSQDNVAWEGILGLKAVFRYHNDFAWHFGTRHYSSHVGDEYIERTGRTRIGYTREEWRAGFAWNLNEQTIFYSDIAYAYSLRNKVLQDHGRVQMGLQYEKPGVFMDGKVGWYSALDISTYEENEWGRNISFQIGFDLPTLDRRWRFGLEYYDGRSQYGEFFQNKDEYVSIGMWIDL